METLPAIINNDLKLYLEWLDYCDKMMLLYLNSDITLMDEDTGKLKSNKEIRQ